MNELDWRLKAWARVSERTKLPDGSWVDKGDVCKVVSVVKLNKKKSLTIPVPELAALYVDCSKKAWDEYKRIKKENKIESSIKSDICFRTDREAFDAIENLSISIIMAFSAIESFCNDSIPNDHEYWHNKNSSIVVEKSDKKDLERRFSTGEKLSLILPRIYGVDSPKGHQSWHSFVKLKRVRDALIHTKSAETRSVWKDQVNIWDKIFLLDTPYLLAKDVFDWFLGPMKTKAPNWYILYPK